MLQRTFWESQGGRKRKVWTREEHAVFLHWAPNPSCASCKLTTPSFLDSDTPALPSASSCSPPLTLHCFSARSLGHALP